jgi:hypothetical protein
MGAISIFNTKRTFMNQIELDNRILVAKFLHGEGCMTIVNNMFMVSQSLGENLGVANPLPEYGQNWDDLYPVIEKISSLGFAFKSSLQNSEGVISIHEGRNMNGHLGQSFIRVESSSRNKFNTIKATYVAILEFIRWYNDEQKEIERKKNVVKLTDDQVVIRFMGETFVNDNSWNSMMEIWSKLKKDCQLYSDWNYHDKDIAMTMGLGDSKEMYRLLVQTIDWYDRVSSNGRYTSNGVDWLAKDYQNKL